MLSIPAIEIGTRDGNLYGPDEWVDVEDLVRLVAGLMLATLKWDAEEEG